MFAWLEMGPYPVRLGFVDNEADMRAFINEYGLDPEGAKWPPPAGALASWWKGESVGTTYLISLNVSKLQRWPDIISVVAHELTHILQFLWRDIQEFDAGAEAEAYLMQWMTKQVMDLIELPERKAA